VVRCLLLAVARCNLLQLIDVELPERYSVACMLRTVLTTRKVSIVSCVPMVSMATLLAASQMAVARVPVLCLALQTSS
jgi:hypothetical protein